MLLNGIILVDKPMGISSAGVLSVIKKKLNGIKLGHAGTLDPDATGLLICLTGKATRLARYAEGGEKIYSGTIAFGKETKTDDFSGDTTVETDIIPDFNSMLMAVEKFKGELSQTPPQVSAIKVNGTRAYKHARNGEFIDLTPRNVTVKDFDITKISDSLIKFKIRCSKGTYIRSIARDLGRELGSAAHLASLRREYSSPFSVQDAVKFDDITENSVISWRCLFPNATQVWLNQKEFRSLKNGDPYLASELGGRASGDMVVCYPEEGEQPIALMEYKDATWNFSVTTW